MASEESIKKLEDFCVSYTLESFNKKKNKKEYFVGEIHELRQIMSEFATSVLMIAGGSQDVTLKGIIEFYAEDVYKKYEFIESLKKK